MAVLSTPLTELLSATARPAVTSSPPELSRLMRRLTPAAEPVAVFRSLTRVVVPRLCDASTVWLSITGQQPSHISFQVADSNGHEHCACRDGFCASRPNVADFGAARVDGDTAVVPINPQIVEGQLPYRGILTMSFHGLRPTLVHLLIGHLLVERAIALVQREHLMAKTENLHRALDSNRDIGAAMGILMARHQLTSDQAFDLLRRTSQRAHRKIVAIAVDVIETGQLERPSGVELLEPQPTPRPPRPPRRAQHLRLAR